MTVSPAREALRELLGDEGGWATETTESMVRLGFTERQVRRAREHEVWCNRRDGRSWWRLKDAPRECEWCGRPYEQDAEQGNGQQWASPQASSAPAVKPEYALGDPNVSTCSTCGKTFMVSPGRPCMALGCSGWLT